MEFKYFTISNWVSIIYNKILPFTLIIKNIKLNIIFRIHICITHLHTKPGVASLFVNNLRQELDEILKNPNVELTGKVNIKINKIGIILLETLNIFIL